MRISDWSSDACSSDLAPDGHRLQEFWLEVAQVHSLPSARPGFQWLPVGNDAARLAAHVPQRPITQDVVFRVPGMTLNRHSSELVVGRASCRERVGQYV